MHLLQHHNHHHNHHLHTLPSSAAASDVDTNSNPDHIEHDHDPDHHHHHHNHHHHHHLDHHHLSHHHLSQHHLAGLSGRDYISSPGYDTSTSTVSTAPASSPDPSSSLLCDFSATGPGSSSLASTASSLSSATSPTPLQPTAQQQQRLPIAPRPVAHKPFGLVNPQAGFHISATAAAVSVSSAAQQQQATATSTPLSSSSSATSSLSKDSTPERSLETVNAVRPMSSLPVHQLAAGGGAQFVAPKRPPSTKIEDRLLSFEIMGASQLAEAERAGTRIDLPKVDVLKRRELFEREPPAAATVSERRRSSGGLIKERLSHLEQRRGSRDDEPTAKPAMKPLSGVAAAVVVAAKPKPAEPETIAKPLPLADVVADNVDRQHNGDDSGISADDLLSTEQQPPMVAEPVTAPAAVIEPVAVAAVVVVVPDVVPTMAAKPLPAVRTEAPPAAADDTSNVDVLAGAADVANVAAAAAAVDAAAAEPVLELDLEQEQETSVSSATLLSVVTSRTIETAADAQNRPLVTLTTTTTTSTTIVSITNDQHNKHNITNTTNGCSGNGNTNTTSSATTHPSSGPIQSVLSVRAPTSTPTLPPKPCTFSAPFVQSTAVSSTTASVAEFAGAAVPKPRAIQATKLPIPLPSSATRALAPTYENVTVLPAPRPATAVASAAADTTAAPAPAPASRNADLLRGISAKLSAAASSATSALCGESPYSSRLKRMTADLRKSVSESMDAKNERLKCQIVGVLEKNRNAAAPVVVAPPATAAKVDEAAASTGGSLSPTPSTASSTASGSRNIFDFIKANLLNETNQNLLEKSTFYVALNEHEAKLAERAIGDDGAGAGGRGQLAKADSTESRSSEVDRLLDEELNRLN